ncbi:hypothetical protein HC928_19455, partial [bacterium]|nr:hypothetical protein [bacterium]
MTKSFLEDAYRVSDVQLETLEGAENPDRTNSALSLATRTLRIPIYYTPTFNEIPQSTNARSPHHPPAVPSPAPPPPNPAPTLAAPPTPAPPHCAPRHRKRQHLSPHHIHHPI